MDSKYQNLDLTRTKRIHFCSIHFRLLGSFLNRSQHMYSFD